MVLLSGGITSPSFKDFFNWAGFYVDEQFRQFGMESYSILAAYPPGFPNVVKMHVRHIWRQSPPKDSKVVPLPTSIGHRL